MSAYLLNPCYINWTALEVLYIFIVWYQSEVSSQKMVLNPYLFPWCTYSYCTFFCNSHPTIFLSGVSSQVSWQRLHLWQWRMCHQIEPRVWLHPRLCRRIWWSSLWWMWNVFYFYYYPFKPHYLTFLFQLLLVKSVHGYHRLQQNIDNWPWKVTL